MRRTVAASTDMCDPCIGNKRPIAERYFSRQPQRLKSRQPRPSAGLIHSSIPLILTKKDARMRRLFPILTVLAALAAPCGAAQALDQAKIDNVTKAADSFAALAKDSFKSGKPPRLSDPAAKPLLETLFNTKDLDGKPQPWSDIDKLHEWTVALTKVGVIYYLAGTGTDNPSVVAGDPDMT